MTVFTRWPVDNPRITQDFGVPNTWENPPWHKGIDIGGPIGTPIYAPCDMFIVWAGGQPFGYGNTWEMIPGSQASGNCIIGQPPAPHTAFQTSFSHLSEILVSPGQWVTAGTLIGLMGSTGNSSGSHLHWEAFIDYNEGSYPAGTFYGRVNPRGYFTTVTVVPITTGGKGSAATEPIEEIDMTAAQDIIKAFTEKTDQQIAWTNQRFNDIAAADTANRNMLAGFVRDVVVNQGHLTVEQIDAKLVELVKPDVSPQPLFKGETDATVYVWEGAGFRALTFEEYLNLISAGAVLQVLPQPLIDATPKAA